MLHFHNMRMTPQSFFFILFFFFKQKTAYEIVSRDWSSDVCSSDLADPVLQEPYALKDGDLIIPEKPGLGLDWNEEVVARHLYT